MEFAAIAEKISNDIAAFRVATETVGEHCERISGHLRTAIKATSFSHSDVMEFIERRSDTEANLETLKTLVPEVIASLDDLRPHYTADAEPDVGHIFEEQTGWRRFIPGLSVKKTTITTRPMEMRPRSVSLQQAFHAAKTWNDEMMALIVDVDDQLASAADTLEESLIDVKEAAILAGREFDRAIDEDVKRRAQVKRLFMEEFAKLVREHLVSLSLYKREFSTLSKAVKDSVEEISEEDEFFNIKSEDDVKRFLGEDAGDVGKLEYLTH